MKHSNQRKLTTYLLHGGIVAAFLFMLNACTTDSTPIRNDPVENDTVTSIPTSGTDLENEQEQPQVTVPEGMVLVPAGTFMMGSTIGRNDEQPIHQVTISRAYYMGKYEVTQAEWEAVMGTNPSYRKGDDLPVENVSWYDAVQYCNALSEKSDLIPAYTINESTVMWNRDANGYRLPTEAEWEWAARGGGKGSLDYSYSGSDTIDTVAWYTWNSGSQTHPVGQKQANRLGLYDMSGNVDEWCWDWYNRYSSDSQIDPMGDSSGIIRVLRGGGWDNSMMGVRSTNRYGDIPDNWGNISGFRLARSLSFE